MHTRFFRLFIGPVLVLSWLFLLCGSVRSASAQSYANPVLPGDYPDPSIIRVGDTYWATATTSQWAPIFPLLSSKDLVNWTLSGAVFEAPPAWSAGSYWAPEIAEDRGRFFVYYTARKKDGPLCVAVATAPAPGGPYTDHGPLVCQAAGSIDAVPVTDENGKRYLIWKEDGNSRKEPTPFWAQPLSADGTTLEGAPREILRNEATWEGHLIEGPFVLTRDGWFYLFYSSGGCCGRKCQYTLGVARARKLLGPWERHAKNPILAANEDWKCPGHGSIVSDARGRTFLLYHAYDPTDFQFTGRQGLLDEVTWSADGWPSINGGAGPSRTAARPPSGSGTGTGAAAQRGVAPWRDDFKAREPLAGWQWPWQQAPVRRIDQRGAGWLELQAGRADASSADADSALGSVFARAASTGDYVAATRIDIAGLRPGVRAGLMAYGDRQNAVGVSVSHDRVTLWLRQKGVEREVAQAPVPAGAKALDLRAMVTDGSRFAFAFSRDGRTWQPIGGDADGSSLPPWDLATRIALTVAGPADARARFDWFTLDPAPPAAKP